MTFKLGDIQAMCMMGGVTQTVNTGTVCRLWKERFNTEISKDEAMDILVEAVPEIQNGIAKAVVDAVNPILTERFLDSVDDV